MGIKGTLFHIKPFAIHDGPGIRTTLFFKGCPLQCAWCHNPEGLSPSPHLLLHPDRCIACHACMDICPEGSPFNATTLEPTCPLCGACISACPAQARELIGASKTVEEVMARVLKDRLFFQTSGGGVTFSGGEPLSQPEFLIALLTACGNEALHRTVDTSGHAPRSVLTEVARKTDLFLFDLKHMDSKKHLRFTGVGNETILSNLAFLSEKKANLWVRMPLIPGFNDDKKAISQAGDFLSGLDLPPPVRLLPYHNHQKVKDALFARVAPYQGPDKSIMRPPLEVAAQLEGMGLEVYL